MRYPRLSFACWTGTPKGRAALGAPVLAFGMADRQVRPSVWEARPNQACMRRSTEAKLELVNGTHFTHKKHARILQQKKENAMSKRFFGLDVHKNYLVAAAVDGNQELVLRPRKIDSADFESWILRHLTCEDEVVIEAMSGAWAIYDLLIEQVARVVVAHPYHVKLIAASFIKTDKRDAVTLARLLAAKIVPEVWVPPRHVSELRALIYHRNNLVRRRAAAKNRLHGICEQYRILAPIGEDSFRPESWNIPAKRSTTSLKTSRRQKN
jgi:hypothetical protein